MAFVFYHGQLLNVDKADRIYLMPPEKAADQIEPGEALGNCWSLGFEYDGKPERVGFFTSQDVAKTAFKEFGDWLNKGDTRIFNMDHLSVELNSARGKS